jgi:hypothetical protein
LVAASLLCIALLAPAGVSPAAARVRPERQRRVLIDASKDGGLWWFPQGRTFDAGKEHQGKPLADLLRGAGWDVTELPRGEVITFEKLQDYDVVVRPPAFFAYSEDEAIAYRQSVAAGTRLILVGGGAVNDAVAAIFGLRFEELSQFTSVHRWMPHPLTENVEGRDLPWTAVAAAPKEAVLLAWLRRSETNSLPVLGYLPYGQGYVTFVGHSLLSSEPARLLSVSLLNSVERHRLKELRGLRAGVPVVTKELAGPSAPGLLQPAQHATLPQPASGEWHFDWEDVPAAQKYELVVLGPAAMFPLVRIETKASEYTVRSRRGGYIAEANLLGWSWRVRAQDRDGGWGPWSRLRRFNVSPQN